jgi:predicted RNA-binding Zn-ribbon protein involved in translation (DUF1610 family)
MSAKNKKKLPQIEITATYPGQGYNHTLEPNKGLRKFQCPCGQTIVISIKQEVKEESTISICPNCESWHSILWKYPSRPGMKFILCGRD